MLISFAVHAAKTPSRLESPALFECQDLAGEAVDPRRVNSWVDQLPAEDSYDTPPGRLPTQHHVSDEVRASSTRNCSSDSWL